MDAERLSASLLSGGLPIGVGLWRSPLKELSPPPWAPRRDFASLCGGKSSTGWRNLWILGGDVGQPVNDIWRSVDGGGTWAAVQAGPHWCPRSRLAVCGAATDPSSSTSGRPIGIMYVVGGQSRSGLHSDVWASDTGGRTWHRMNSNAAFGPRADAACAVVPPDPLVLVVGGGISSDAHRDLWLSRDAGETFSLVDIPHLQPGIALVQWPPDLLCAARSRQPGKLSLWRLVVKLPDVREKGAPAVGDLEALDDDWDAGLLQDPFYRVSVPPRVTVDLELQVAISWDPQAACLVAQPLSGRDAGTAFPMKDVRAPGAGDAHVMCDMDAANFGWETLRHGRLWVFSGEGSRSWTSDRTRFAAQERFIKLLGEKLAEKYGLPGDLWTARLLALLLPYGYRPQLAPAAHQSEVAG